METKKTVFSKINASVRRVWAVEDYVLDKRITSLFRKKDFLGSAFTICQEIQEIETVEKNLTQVVDGEELTLYLQYTESIKQLFQVVCSICMGLNENLQGNLSEYKWKHYSASLSLLEQRREICNACQKAILAFPTKASNNRFDDLKNRAERGNAVAQRELAIVYYTGNGVQKNEAEGLKWVTRSAENGDAQAQYDLGMMYDGGAGVPCADITLAVKWFHRAAEQGHAEAQGQLGYKYKNGRGVLQNDEKAMFWFQKAAAQNHEIAQANLGDILFKGIGVTPNKVEAVQWYLKSALQGNGSAQMKLGRAYAAGLGVEQNFDEALRWIRKSAEGDFPEIAQNCLAAMQYENKGVPWDDVEATKWIQKAATQNLPVAQYYLGKAYACGIGVPKADGEAIHWFSKAAAQGLAIAQYELGRMYADGKGTPKDLPLAYAYALIVSEYDNTAGGDLLNYIKKQITTDQIATAERLREKLKMSWAS